MAEQNNSNKTRGTGQQSRRRASASCRTTALSVKSMNQCVHIYIVHSSNFLCAYFLAAQNRCGRVSARRGGAGKTIVTCHQLEPKWRRVGEGHMYIKQIMVQTRSPTAENKNTSQVTYLICFYLTLYVFYMMLYSFSMILHVFT